VESTTVNEPKPLSQLVHVIYCSIRQRSRSEESN
jgi:hypothetical protein